MRDFRGYTTQQLYRLLLKIRSRFEEASRGDPYGWDWPTMWVIMPVHCELHEQIKAEFMRR